MQNTLSNTTERASGGPGSQILGIPITLDVVLGSTKMSVASLMKLTVGDVVTLDRKIGEPVELSVNGKVVARGEIVVTGEDSRLGVSLSEVVSS